MKYIDLHCDALTKEGVAAVSKESLSAGGCALQCFAAFIDPRKQEGFARALALADAFDAMCEKAGFSRYGAPADRAPYALLTVEGGEAIEGSLEKLEALYRRGVRMMTLTWNFPNALGFPCGDPEKTIEGVGHFGGLTPFGRTAVERMAELGMLVDVSHGSDRLVEDVADVLGHTPFVASHSGARSAYAHPRNLTDAAIRRVAESGGVVGLCLVPEFLAGDTTYAGQKKAFFAHVRRVLQAGGEDVLAFGSDFDGAPQNPYIPTPAAAPRLFEDLTEEFSFRLAEKLLFSNPSRLLAAPPP